MYMPHPSPKLGADLKVVGFAFCDGLAARGRCGRQSGIRAPLLQGNSNGSMVDLDRDPEGELESRLELAGAGRGQDVRTARRDGEYM